MRVLQYVAQAKRVVRYRRPFAPTAELVAAARRHFASFTHMYAYHMN